MKTQAILNCLTPAKITARLRILAKRQDGYHEVQILLIPVGLYDRLSLKPKRTGGIQLRVASEDSLGAVEDNLVYRAARRFEQALGTPLHVEFRLEKNIPAGAGLGGGSGNAAGALVGLNSLFGQPFSEDTLRALGGELGSDIPFFITPLPTLAEGRGERLTPLEGLPKLALLIAKPPLSISTAEAYGRWQPEVPRGPQALNAAPREPLPALHSAAAIAAALQNDFMPVLGGVYPILGELRDRFLDRGALGAVLSGSGSAVVGVFADEGARDAAALTFAGDSQWKSWVCDSLSHHAYLTE
ncbi:MAG: 4-(cytidine 5'-diphospho)-2-C-methyl-D-erythritol kinase [Deltaproteobacteria bacterium]|nr:4-(cytidine 5'-diphospho)-2-C-methyl-D-erythritol kinase [Deltaproteobacteria bacterium]